MPSIVLSPYTLLVSLALLATLARTALLRGRAVPTAAPASLMAAGIFVLAALPRLPDPARSLSAPLAVALLVLWGHMAASFAAAAVAGRLGSHVRPPVGRFAIGTWVAGTAVLAEVIVLEIPDWRALAIALGCLAGALWLWFVPLAIAGFHAIVAAPGEYRANGAILLATVSTQSLVTLADSLFPDWPALRWIAEPLIILGYVFYAAGAALILRRYRTQAGWRLAEDWENPNCILHGAMSITGLAAVTNGVLPFAVCYGTWLYAAAAFLLVEAVEVARLAQRLRLHGWRRGLCVYDVSQWSRNFTFGMFCAFTLAFSQTFGTAGIAPTVKAVQDAIVRHGPSVVLTLLLIEIGLFAWSQRPGRLGP